jgi:hypothetical protein
MTVQRVFMMLASLAACTTSPTLGTANITDSQVMLLGYGPCQVGMIETDVGWSLGYACLADQGDEPPKCSDLNVAVQLLTIVITKAAVRSTGQVALTTEPQTADVPSIAITNVPSVIAAGTFTLSKVSGSLSATFDAGSGSNTVSGTITDAPYCP